MEKSKEEKEEASHASAAPGDWVKDLFAPIFDFDAIVDAGKHGFKDDEPHIKRAAILDPETVREVFERVHHRVVEAERLKQLELQEKRQKEEDDKIDPRKSSIWDTEELETLRKVYKAAKGEIIRLEISVKQGQKLTADLQAQLARERQRLQALQTRLTEVSNANQRLVIHRDSLLQQAGVMEVKLAALTDMWHEIDALKLRATEEAQAARLQLDSERLLRQKLETDLDAHRQNAQRDTDLARRDVETRYEMEVNDLNDVIKDLSLELVEEKRRHEASKRGLDHLRLHFSSLPLREVLPPGAVVEDQVARVDHIDKS